MTLAEALSDVGRELGAGERRTADGVEWLRGGSAFAACSADSAEFLLAPAIADAALRTPDVAASARGRGWVAFAPTELDRFALDRATAWFASAWRHAAD